MVVGCGQQSATTALSPVNFLGRGLLALQVRARIEGVATLPANNTYTEVRAGIRVEDDDGDSQPAMITISE